MELVDPVLLHIHAYEVSLSRGDPTTLPPSSISNQLASQQDRGMTSQLRHRGDPNSLSNLLCYQERLLHRPRLPRPLRLSYQGGPKVTSLTLASRIG